MDGPQRDVAAACHAARSFQPLDRVDHVDRSRARALAATAVATGDPTGWFEQLYREAQAGAAVVPWADRRPNPHLAAWPGWGFPEGRFQGRRALVVGCGLGDDAEWLAARGLAVSAFDVAPTAIAACRARFAGSSVEYRVADVLAMPASWSEQRFDLVVEAYTLQVLPPGSAARTAAFEALASVTGDTLLVVARGRDVEEDQGSLPWPLTVGEMRRFEAFGLACASFEDFADADEPAVRRFRATYRRSGT